MTFTQSIRHCLTNYATFRGRASRSEYWWFVLFSVILAMVPGLAGMALIVPYIDQLEAGVEPATPILAFVFLGLTAVIYLGLLLPLIAVAVRRFHDRNLSGWIYLGLILAGFIPLVGWIANLAIFIITLLKGTPGPNKFGEDPLRPSADVFA